MKPDILKIEKAYDNYRAGRKAHENGQVTEAIKLLKKSVAIMPHFKTYEVLGELLLTKKKYSESILYLSAAAGLGNKTIRARYLLAKALLLLDEKWSVNAYQQLVIALIDKPDYKAARELSDDLLKSNELVKQWAASNI